MIPRVLEPEAMDTPEEVLEYDRMDHSEVNARFVADLLTAHGACRGGWILDVGTGTARIPIALAWADARARILALDLADNMLARAAINIVEAGLENRIRCFRGDVKSLDGAVGGERFEAVISNTIIHHIPKPAPALEAMIERVAPSGTLMIRDLVRPDSLREVARLVELHAGNESDAARGLFEASLRAGLTLEEIRAVVELHGLPGGCVVMSSDRHWTVTWHAPA
jgi:ubiquinone/menaquinone biosynthesis C-methylase UbiE